MPSMASALRRRLRRTGGAGRAAAPMPTCSPTRWRSGATMRAPMPRRSGGWAAVDFDDLIATAVALLAAARDRRVGALQARPGDRTCADRRGAGYQPSAVDDRAGAGQTSSSSGAVCMRRRRARCSRSAITSRRFSGFRGPTRSTSPAAEQHFGGSRAAAHGDADSPEDDRGLPLARLSLTHSFRSTAPVLQFVDAAVAAIGEPGLGHCGGDRARMPAR